MRTASTPDRGSCARYPPVARQVPFDTGLGRSLPPADPAGGTRQTDAGEL